jgi:D-alanyl-D-alanine carboxypeptidase
MRRVRSEPSSGLRGFVFGVAVVGTAITFSTAPADARYHRYYTHRAAAVPHATRGYHHARAESYSPPTSSIVVDGNTGAVLHASNAEGLRHPASLTKIMTLYLLFERLEAGKIKLDTPLKITAHASEQSPTKLGVKPGQTLAVEDAIKAVVTKSANDAAVAIAENLGGDEDEFAKMMTAKAHALGMSRTTYVNASGLPNDDQITTAQDQALLGRAIQERFPRYYRYFSTEQFVYHGHAMRNHNHLLGVVGGVDGIKTGYTHASGFNLVTSVHRDGRYIVAVVLGGRSAGERDAHMRELINSHIRDASPPRTAPAIAERMEARPEPRSASSERSEQREPKPIASAKSSLSSRADPTTTGKTNGGTAVASDPIQPLLVKTITYRTAPVQAAPLAPMPALVAAAPLPRSPAMPLPTLPAAPPAPAPAAAAPTPAAAPPPTPAPVTTAAQAAPAPAVDATAATTAARGASAPAVEAATTVVVASTEPAVVAPSIKLQTPGRSVIAKSDSARPEAPRSEAARLEAAKSETATPEAAKLEVAKLEPAKPEAAKSELFKSDLVKSESAKSESAKSESAKSEPAKPVAAKTEIVKPEPSAAQIRARGGWVIQIGAFEAEEEAKQHLSEARLKIPRILASADPFTERVQKGDKALYRARFAGFDKAMAEAACKQLKRSDIACLTVKN